MDILNAPVWARTHAQRPDIRAIKAERRVIARYGEDSPQVRELRAIPISCPRLQIRSQSLATKSAHTPNQLVISGSRVLKCGAIIGARFTLLCDTASEAFDIAMDFGLTLERFADQAVKGHPRP